MQCKSVKQLIAWSKGVLLNTHKNTTNAKPAFEIDPKYADDMWATTSKERIHQIKHTVPSRLKARQLCINESNTEEYTVEREGDERWKKCRLLGSLLDTNEDIADILHLRD